MSGVPFHYVDLRAFSYATEDEKRVAQALQRFLPEDTHLDRSENDGFHGDRIVVLSARVETAEAIRHVLATLADMNEGARVVAELEDRITEDCELYLYLDKQAAFNGRAALGQGLTFRAKVEAYPANKANAVANARDALTTLTDGNSP